MMYFRILALLLSAHMHWKSVEADCNVLDMYGLSAIDNYSVWQEDCESHPVGPVYGPPVESVLITCGRVDNVFTSSHPGDTKEFIVPEGMRRFYISELVIPGDVIVSIGKNKMSSQPSINSPVTETCSVLKLIHGAPVPFAVDWGTARKFRIRATGPGVLLKFQCSALDRQCQKHERHSLDIPYLATIKVYYSIHNSPTDFAACNSGGYVSDDDTESNVNCANGNTMKTMDCGGSIIHENWILSAGNCYLDTREIGNIAGFNLMGALVTVGAHPEHSHPPDPETRWVPKQRIITHPQLNAPGQFNNDLALLKVSPPINLDEDSRYPICLPPSYFKDRSWAYNGLDYTAAVNQDNETTDCSRSGSISDADLGWWACQQVVPHWSMLTHNMLCTSITVCPGDEGSPGVCTLDNFVIAAGIASFSNPPNDWAIESIFTKVAEYLPWIEATIAPDQLP